MTVMVFHLFCFSFIVRDEKEEKEKDDKFLLSFKEFWKSIDSAIQQQDKQDAVSGH